MLSSRKKTGCFFVDMLLLDADVVHGFRIKDE